MLVTQHARWGCDRQGGCIIGADVLLVLALHSACSEYFWILLGNELTLEKAILQTHLFQGVDHDINLFPSQLHSALGLNYGDILNVTHRF